MRIKLLVVILCTGLKSMGQDYSPYKNIGLQLQQFSLISDSLQKANEIEKWFSVLRNANQIPFAIEDSVLFLYWGNAASVSWMGDFNGWGHDQAFKNKGAKVPNTNIW